MVELTGAHFFKTREGRKVLLKFQKDSITLAKEELKYTEVTPKQKEKLEFQHKLNIAKASGLYTTQELLEYEIQLVKESEKLLSPAEKYLATLKLQGQVIEANVKEVAQFSQALEKTWATAFADVLKGEEDIKGFFDRIGEYWRNTFIETFAEAGIGKLFEVTGIGDIFGGMMVGAEDMFKSPAEKIKGAGET